MLKRLVLVSCALFSTTCINGVPVGLLQGFVVDGLTGARLDFFEADGALKNVSDNDAAETQIYALVKGEFVRATPCAPNDASEENKINTSGCFLFADLPALSVESIPIFAQRPGYQPFEGTVTFPAPPAPIADDAARANEINLTANIRMFPVGHKVDYTVLAHVGGAPIANASVNCQLLAGANAFQVAGGFITPTNSTLTPAVAKTTDAEGVATIPGAELVLGGPYHCEVFRSEPMNGNVLSGDFNFTAGVGALRVNVALTAGGPDGIGFYVMRSNVDDPNDLLGDNATLVVQFNRPVELVPGTNDCMEARLNEPDSNNNGTTGALPTSTFGNNESENVTASMSGDGLTLSVNFHAPTTALDSGDRGTTVTFDGIYVRPTGDDRGTARVIGFSTGCTADNFAPLSGAASIQNLRTGAAQSRTLRLY